MTMASFAISWEIQIKLFHEYDFLLLKSVIDSHHFFQRFPRNLLLLQSMRKCDYHSTYFLMNKCCQLLF